MSIGVQSDFLTNVNRMFDNLTFEKDEDQREKFINRAIAIRDIGMGDITEQSKITGSFFREFSNVSIPSAGETPTHEERLAALSRRYTEMRDELTEMFSDDEDEFCRQMGKLNMAFKGALDSTCLTPIYSFKAVNIFYENFIKSIQTNDFDTAYQENISLLKNGETTSDNEISYSDMVRIMDIPNNVPTEFDEQTAKKEQETIKIIYINPQGERIMKITSKKGTRHIKIGHVKDVIWTEPMISE